VRGPYSGDVMRSMVAALTGLLAAAGVASGASAAIGGRWVASGPSGKIVLQLKGSGKVLRGTWAQGGKTSKVTAKVTNADGAQQVTLTFTQTKRSMLCGIHASKLYCPTETGLATFAHA